MKIPVGPSGNLAHRVHTLYPLFQATIPSCSKPTWNWRDEQKFNLLMAAKFNVNTPAIAVALTMPSWSASTPAQNVEISRQLRWHHRGRLRDFGKLMSISDEK